MGRAARTSTKTRGSGGVSPRWMWPIFVASSAAFFVGVGLDDTTLRLGLKAIPALSLAVAVYLTDPRSGFRRIIAVGLAFGAAGDLLLEMDAFVPGLVAFLVGHVVYIAAFVRLSSRLAPLLAVPYLVVGVALTVFVAEGAGDLLVPVIAYAVVISVMGWRSAALIGRIPAATAAPLAVGAGLFIVSDALIAINRFRFDISGSDWWIMLTYLAAQALIALGAVRSEAP